jgi:hypothetical protein
MMRITKFKGLAAAIPILLAKQQDKGYVNVYFEVEGNAADVYA